jgi:DNA replication protein DnaC
MKTSAGKTTTIEDLPMLTQPLLEKLSQLHLMAFRAAFEDQLHNPHYADLSFEERLGLLVDIEITRRTNYRWHRRIQSASFPLQATLEDLDLSAGRGLQRALILELAQGEWVRRHLNLLVLGATGTGKTYLSCALGRAACETEFTVRYVRTSRLLQSLQLAQADGSYPQLLRSLARTHLLIFDDRYGRSSTLVATQVPVSEWHARIPDPTIADSVLDRLIHNAFRLNLSGDSMRKVHSPLNNNDY